jgi:uncharacterized protein YkwD
LNYELEFAENIDVSLMNRSTHLSNALTFGQKFEKLADDSFESKISWELKKEELEESTHALLNQLMLKNQSKSKLIIAKMKKINPEFKYEKQVSFLSVKKEDETLTSKLDEPIKNEPIKNDYLATKKETRTLEVNTKEINYNVIPTGYENIPSASLKKEEEIIALINAERKSKGLTILKIDPSLCRAARYHASDLAHQGYFDHDTHNVKNNKMTKELGTFERIGLFYDGFANTENIAGGNSSSEGTYQQWFHSKGHHVNMLNKAATKVGIGYVMDENSPYKHYWVFCTAAD